MDGGARPLGLELGFKSPFHNESSICHLESKAETQVHGALKAAYYDAFRAARQEIILDDDHLLS